MQKSITAKKDELKREINLDSARLKEKIDRLRAIDPTIAKKVVKRKAKKIELPKSVVSINRFDEIVYRFKCPDCNSSHTKRTGLTTQREPKARFLCLNCQQNWRENKNVDRMFFTLSSKEILDILNNDKNLTKEKREFFIERYLIKK